MKIRRELFVGAIAGAAFLGAQAQAAETTKIAYIDPLSGGGASIGEIGLKHFQFLADKINAEGGLNGKKVEILGFDNKTNPQDALIQAQKAIDQGARILTQGNGSSVAAAISDFVAKYNERNPGKEVIYLNYAAVDPSLTNEKCNYWHFRWDANSGIKMKGRLRSMGRGRRSGYPSEPPRDPATVQGSPKPRTRREVGRRSPAGRDALSDPRGPGGIRLAEAFDSFGKLSVASAQRTLRFLLLREHPAIAAESQ
jgi:Periplasmic binding protein